MVGWFFGMMAEYSFILDGVACGVLAVRYWRGVVKVTDFIRPTGAVKSGLITTIGDTIRVLELTRPEAARLCGTDQTTLSKVLRGRMESMTIDKLAAWRNALGRTVEVYVRPYDRNAKSGQLVVSP